MLVGMGHPAVEPLFPQHAHFLALGHLQQFVAFGPRGVWVCVHACVCMRLCVCVCVCEVLFRSVLYFFVFFLVFLSGSVDHMILWLGCTWANGANAQCSMLGPVTRLESGWVLGVWCGRIRATIFDMADDIAMAIAMASNIQMPTARIENAWKRQQFSLVLELCKTFRKVFAVFEFYYIIMHFCCRIAINNNRATTTWYTSRSRLICLAFISILLN